MKEFKLIALKKFGVALMFFFGLMLFSSVSFAQTAQQIQNSIDLLSERKTKLETIRNETYSTNDPKYGFFTDVINHIQWGIDLAEAGDFTSIPEDFMTQADKTLKKIDPSILQEYSSSDLTALEQSRGIMIAEGSQNTIRFLKVDLILKANGL